jgi:hypothetical protein
MARPRMIGLRYFSLDTRFDEKVEALEAVHGNDGFAVWIKTMQAVYLTDDGKLPVPTDLMCRVYAKRCNVTPDVWRAAIATCVEVGLFDVEAFAEGTITSPGIQKRITAVRTSRENDRNRQGAGDPSEIPPPDDADYPGGIDEQPEGFPTGKLPDKCTNGKGKGNGEETGLPGACDSSRTPARETTGRTVTRSVEFDPSVYGVHTSDGVIILNAESLVDKALIAYHLPDELRDPVLAWIEIHDNRIPSQHDCRTIRKRCEESSVELVTTAIRRMGNDGMKKPARIPDYVAQVVAERRKAEKLAQQPRPGAQPRGDA